MEFMAQAALVHLSAEMPLLSAPCFLRSSMFSNISTFSKPRNSTSYSSGSGAGATCRVSRWAERLLGDFQFNPNPAESTSPSSSSAVADPPGLSHLPTAADHTIPLPIDFYQVLGAETHFLADGIRRAYEARVSKPSQYGFSQEALIGRRQILQAACDTLSNPSSRSDYNRGLTGDLGSTLTIHVPLDKVPGALCLLQEAGEAETILEVGGILLREWLPKPFKQDVVLAMVLAYVDLSRDAMALNPPDFMGCRELLQQALKLLQEEGASNLARDLLVQIDETLEEISPRCAIELLALPLDEEHVIKRQDGLHSVRSILWTVGKGGAAVIGGGFTREDFMNEAFVHMTASEQIDLFAATPSDIPAESFEVYNVALALVAHAIVGKKAHLIKDAGNLFQQLQQSKVTSLGSNSEYTMKADRDVDFALERGLCSLLLGELDECYSWLGIDDTSSPYRNQDIVDFIMSNLNVGKDHDFLPGLCKLLETWLIEVVFSRFRDTQGVQFRLRDYYDDPTVLRYLEKMEGGGASPLAAAASIVKIGAEATAVFGNVKSNVVDALQKVFPLTKREGRNSIEVSAGVHNSKFEVGIEEPGISIYQYVKENKNEAYEKPNSESSNEQDYTYMIKEASIKIMCAGIAVGILTVAALRYLPRRNLSPGSIKEVGSEMAANAVLSGSRRPNAGDMEGPCC
ncbi:protein ACCUMULATION AND REPLICATION OF CHLOROPLASTS 6, chloroplastic isoform X2 [Phalaenopsis equestris]|uniref:protein ACCUMULATION AND REPLICATION OF CHLOROPLASTS 6, chloroplastic isoform X2 n=1 Tax=Phalaenopsis equestris TaxID=78828 RepID=UPI0009E37C7D|nr:protein ACCUMULATION AND REPLICATION OF CHLOROPLASTS 6, chloroplastic isoform X2 [Phalaenopsis equestris]